MPIGRLLAALVAAAALVLGAGVPAVTSAAPIVSLAVISAEPDTVDPDACDDACETANDILAAGRSTRTFVGSISLLASIPRQHFAAAVTPVADANLPASARPARERPSLTLLSISRT